MTSWLAAAVLMVAAADALAQSAGRRRNDPWQVVASRAGQILSGLGASGDTDAAQRQVDVLFDQVIAHAPGERLDLFGEVVFARRLVRFVHATGGQRRRERLDFLLRRPALTRTLMYLMRTAYDRPEDVMAVLEKLGPNAVEQERDPLETYAELAAAIAVVHDRALKRRINENQVESDEPAGIFAYFVRHERSMLFGLRGLPPELLVYVVDATASIPEMRWALSRYEGDQEVGRRFFDIAYDHEHFREGRPKRVTEAGFDLPNIAEHGGVCADQAYFAMSVGKAIGVPTAYTVGRSAQIGHAWVGFLQQRGRRTGWNFDSGRYKAYQGVRGVVMDPQTRQRVPDSFVSLRAELIGTSAGQRHAAIAMTDAALRLREIEKSGQPFDPEPLLERADEPTVAEGAALEAAARPDPPRSTRRPQAAPASSDLPRQANIETELRLIETGLRRSPGTAVGWHAVRDLATDGALSLEQKRRWAGVLQKLCGRRYPDFMLEILVPMIRTVDAAPAQNELWERTFAMLTRRSDLAAMVRMEQARMWIERDEPARAGRCYEDVINRFLNAGPFVIDALQRSEDLLRQMGRDDKVLVLYEGTWQRIEHPKDMAPEFKRQSNWYRVGRMLADRLADAGRGRAAEQLRERLERELQRVPRRRGRR